MVGVKMREEDLGQRKTHPVAHHLALRALAALEQERLTLADQRHRGDVAFHGGAGGGGAEKRHAQHAAEYKGEKRGEWCVVLHNDLSGDAEAVRAPSATTHHIPRALLQPRTTHHAFRAGYRRTLLA